jgi:hypothetical protein
LKIDDSLFAALRIVALMLGVDGTVDPKEEKWFLWLLNTYGATSEQREILQREMRGFCKVEEVHPLITGAQDRERLLNWARVAMDADGVIDPKEKELFEKIKELNQRVSNVESSEYFDLAKSILQLEKENQLWKELAEAGKIYSEKRYNSLYGSNYFASSMIVRGLSTGNRFFKWSLVAFVVIYALLRIFARYLG